MDAKTILEAVKLAWEILGPLATKMVEKLMSGKDPMEVLLDERLHEIIPSPLKLKAARLAARIARGLPPDA